MDTLENKIKKFEELNKYKKELKKLKKQFSSSLSLYPQTITKPSEHIQEYTSTLKNLIVLNIENELDYVSVKLNDFLK